MQNDEKQLSLSSPGDTLDFIKDNLNLTILFSIFVGAAGSGVWEKIMSPLMGKSRCLSG